MSQTVRPVALAIILRPETGELLVFEGCDPSRDLTYHRPLGGGIEFGESVAEAVRREIMEEIGVPVTVVRELGCLESRFVANGKPKHEVAFLVECAFEDAAQYDRDLFEDREGNGEHGIWRRPDDRTVLFPEALPDMLADMGGAARPVSAARAGSAS